MDHIHCLRDSDASYAVVEEDMECASSSMVLPGVHHHSHPNDSVHHGSEGNTLESSVLDGNVA